MEKRRGRGAALLLGATLLATGCATTRQAANEARTLSLPQADIRDYTQADFSSGLEAVVRSEPGIRDARVFSLGNLVYTAVLPTDAFFSLQEDGDRLTRIGDRLRGELGFRATVIHVTSDEGKYRQLDDYAQRLVRGGALPSVEVGRFLQEWEKSESNRR